MAWGAQFLAALDQPVLMTRWVLRATSINNTPADPGYFATSIAGSGDPIIAERGVRIDGSALSAGAWSSSTGQCDIELSGDLSRLLQSVTRGTFCTLQMGLEVGGGQWVYETVFIGQVQQIERRGLTTGTLSLRDLLSALRSRPTLTAGQLALFYADDGDTTVDSPWTVGDTTLSIVAGGTFERDSAGKGAVQIEPTTGEPFYLLWTGTPGATSLTISGPSTDRHGTTPVDADSGDAVHPLLYIEAHPINAARKILCSTGGGNNGAYDTLPISWGLGLRDAWIDHTDADSYLQVSRSVMDWEFLADAQITDPLGWLTDILARGGFFLTVRQGLLTVRAALSTGISVLNPGGTAGTDVLHLTDMDIESIACELWDQDASEESVNVTVYANSTSASIGTEAPATLPAIDRAEYDLADLLFSDEADAASSILSRVWEATQRVPERYTITCSGLRAAQLAPGDLIRISTRRIGGRMQATLRGLVATRALVVQVSPDFGSGRVEVVALVYPLTGEVWS